MALQDAHSKIRQSREREVPVATNAVNLDLVCKDAPITSTTPTDDVTVHPMYGKKLKFSKEQLNELFSVVGNHAATESQWVRACHLLGDHTHRPENRNQYASLALTFAAAALVLMIAIPWHNNYIQSDQSDIVPPPPAAVATPEDVQYANYMSRLQPTIKSHWKPGAFRETLHSAAIFTIDRSGKLSDEYLSESSGNAQFDRESLEAVRSAAPFEVLPPGKSASIKVQFNFDRYVEPPAPISP